MQALKSEYKKTKIGLLPIEWNVKELGEFVIEMKSGLSRKLSNSDIGLPVLRSNNIINKSISFDELKYWYINDPQGANTENYYLKDGDILVNFINSLSQIGKTAIYTNKINRNVIYTTNILKLTLKSELNSKYFIYISDTKRYKDYIISITKPAVNQASFTTGDYKKLLLPIPVLKEQEKIVEILSTWDSAIEKQEQLIEKKKEFKKGLMQRLLSGEVRFKEFTYEWSIRNLENYITPVSRECDKPNEGYWRLGLRSHGKGTFHEFVEDPSTVSMDKLYKVKCNDLIVNITFAWEHAIAIANSMDEEKLVSHRFPTYEFKENAYPLFFKYYILQPKFKHMLVNISPGGAGRNRVMNKKDFLKLIVKIPKYNEQVRIAEVLIAADKEIELLEKELKAFKLQKKGLMQRLLTGEIRVKV